MEAPLDKTVSKEYKKYLEAASHVVRLDTLGPFFSLNEYNLSGEKIKTFSIELKGDEFYVIDGHLLLYRNGMIRIYRYDERFRCTRTRSMDLHLLTFLVKKKAMNQRCRFLFYNILLHLVKNNERKYDAKLREIMCYMCVDWMVDVKFGDRMVLCTYRNGESRVYNSRLQLISDSFSCRREKGIMECGAQKIRVTKSCVEIARDDWSFKSLISIGEVVQYIALGDSLFLLTRDSIKILSFEE
ncbi:hypothetical protein [Encephalitozoon cuniculi GB-M1]|uniref:Uncharacterized protein n=2 Tax=Encephalitozoon cuniculi TaxID=6035 RepID=Q8SWN4_ENCCU|nr:uncharacterized protein ECU01_0520 [Encephalitozoon cuniculi GB-M1]CAD24921.2 hypothetical protein [Encephalitozoon cuniculi GB-M1]